MTPAQTTTQPAPQPLPLTSVEALQAERAELDLLLDEGVDFTVPRLYTGRFSTSKTRTWKLRAFHQGTMNRLSREFIDLNYDPEAVAADLHGEAKRLVAHNAVRLARIVAIAVLNDYFRLKFFVPILTWYFAWRITSRKMLQITMLINEVLNLSDFIVSTRFLSVVPRTTQPLQKETAPARVETPGTPAPDSGAFTAPTGPS